MTPIPTHPELTLLPEGAAWLADSATLILADLHLGKSAAFRAKGLPVPEGDNARDFGRMLALAERYQAARLIIAGDLFHASGGITPELEADLSDFIHLLGIPLILVLGNHDAKIQKLPDLLHVFPHLDLGETIRIIHDPQDAKGERLHLCGHWHPVVKIPDGKRTSLRLPCFLFRNNTLVLPAFGSFTGGAILTAEPDDRVFIALRDQIVELPSTLIS